MLANWDRNPMLIPNAGDIKDFNMGSFSVGDYIFFPLLGSLTDSYYQFHSRASGRICEFESRFLAKTIARALEQRLHRRPDGKSIQQDQVDPKTKIKGSNEALYQLCARKQRD
jgi:hypothetical protein